MIWLGSVSH